jgi:hypothetical protein
MREKGSLQTDCVCETEGASRLYASAHVFYFRPILSDEVQLVVDFTEVLAGQDFETGDHSLAREVNSGFVGGRFRDLDLQGAFSKVETENFIYVVLHLGFEDDIVTSDAEIDVALPDERRDIRGGEEHPVSRTSELMITRWFRQRLTARDCGSTRGRHPDGGVFGI